MADPLITADELSRRLTPALYRAVFNDHNTGEPDEAAVTLIREDASSKVRGTLGASFPLEDLLADSEVYAPELRRITLDVAHAMCAQRKPTLIEIDGFAMMKQAEEDLQKIREGYAGLSSNPDDPAEGGSTVTDSGSATGDIAVVITGRTTSDGRPVRFSDDWGDFG